MSDDEDGGVVFFDNGAAAAADTELDEGDELSWEDKLKSMTGEDDLACVTSLKYTIDTSTSSLVDLLALLPALRSLTLESGSCVTSLRELGSGARQLEILTLECCNLLELDGIASMRRLKELHLPRNHIHDLEPLSSVSAPIEVIDLSGNLVWSFSQIDFLGSLDRLRDLSLSSCPIAFHRFYRRRVIARIAEAGIELQRLDDVRPSASDNLPSSENDEAEPLSKLPDALSIDLSRVQQSQSSRRPASSSSTLRPSTSSGAAAAAASLGFVRHNIVEPVSVSVEGRPPLRPGSARAPMSPTSDVSLLRRPPSASRPSSSLPSTAPSSRPGSMRSRLGSSGGESSGVSGFLQEMMDQKQEAADMASANSELTQGGIVCGNPIAALRRRRSKDVPPLSSPTHSSSPTDLHALNSARSVNLAAIPNPMAVAASRGPHVLMISSQTLSGPSSASSSPGQSRPSSAVMNAPPAPTGTNVISASSVAVASKSAESSPSIRPASPATLPPPIIVSRPGSSRMGRPTSSGTSTPSAMSSSLASALQSVAARAALPRAPSGGLYGSR